MPTPGDENSAPAATNTSAPPPAPHHQTTSSSALPGYNATCPPDPDRRSDEERLDRRDRDDNAERGESPGSSSAAESSSTVTGDSPSQWRSDATRAQSGAENKEERSVKAMAIEDDETMAESSPSFDSGSPTVAASPSAVSSSSQMSSGLAVRPSYESSPLNFEYSNVRVRWSRLQTQSELKCSIVHTNACVTAASQLFVVLPTRRQQVRGHPALRPPGVQCGRGD